jgi:phage-related protein
MAVYKSGLEVDEKVLRAGEFEIVFDCKPQRYLMSGEVPIDVSSGDTILGPTLFDSHPMLEVTGYGEIGINGEVVAINDAVLGQTKISTRTDGKSVTLDVSNLNEGDLIYKLDTDKPVLEYGMKPKSGTFGTAEITSVSNCTAYISGGSTKQKIIVVPDFPQIAQGTSVTVNASVSLTLVVGGVTYNGTITVPLSYNGSTNVISMNVSRSDMPSTSDVTYDSYYQHPAYYSDSTKLVYPAPMYIDLDIGEAYGVVNDEVLSFNNIVSMPAELPVLKPGSNTITFDNTVTDLKIVPRWWKI